MKTIKGILPYLKGFKALLFASIFLALISVSCKMAIPFVLGKAIDQLKDGQYDISLYLIIIAALIGIGAAFRYLFDFSVSCIGQGAVKKMRDELYLAYQNAPISYLDEKEEGDLLLRLTNDIENIQNGLILGAASLYEGVIQILITVFFLFYVHWLLALVVILLTPISILVSHFVSKANSKHFKAQNKALGQLSAFCLEDFSNMEAIHSYGMEERREESFEKKNAESRDSSFKATFASAWINPSTRLVNNIIYATLAILGALFLANGWTFGIAFTVGGLSSFLSYAFQYMTPFNEISNVASEVFYAQASLERVLSCINAPKDVDEGSISQVEEISSIEAKGIRFSYDGKRQIISDFDLSALKGQKIALVGPTGCGKTTIINLLMRFYDPQEGHFSVNGESTLNIRKQAMRSHFGMVLQESWLKKATIKENIAYGNPSASFDEIKEAARKARAEEFILRLPNGYDTYIDKESGLSAGEKQLICVARILLCHPEVILLDEATSNIDLRTELALSSSFDELMKGKTSIVVAHRLSTIENADIILVLKDGKIIEQGNFSSLLKQNGFFAELYKAQLS